MARFNAWANRRLFETVAQLAESEYRADRGAFFGSVHATLNHVLVVDLLWTGRIEGRDRGVTSLDQILHGHLAGLRATRATEDQAIIDLVDGLSGDALTGVISYRRVSDNTGQRTPCGVILSTLFNHQTHHRGQVHCLLTQAGITPPPLDIIYALDEIAAA